MKRYALVIKITSGAEFIYSQHGEPVLFKNRKEALIYGHMIYGDTSKLGTIELNGYEEEGT